MKKEDLIKCAKDIFSQKDDNSSWVISQGIKKDIQEAVDFMEFRHWPPPTADTMDLPRPVFNLPSLVVNTQVSNILGSPTKLIYKAPGEDIVTDLTTQFVDYLLKEAKFDKFVEDIVFDAEIKGTGILYVYWDEYANDRKGKYKGAIRFTNIDPLDIFVSNPLVDDIQRQEWIIIQTRENVDDVRNSLGENFPKDKIDMYLKPDDYKKNYTNEVEYRGSKQITVLTKFFRKDGEVFFQKCVQGICLHEPLPMNPNISKKIVKLEFNKEGNTDEIKMDGGNHPTQDSELESNTNSTTYRFGRYPFEVLTTVSKNKSFYGIGTVKGIIPTNKLINLTIAYNMLNTQNLAWGKILVKNGALKQKVTNKPGQVLIDYTPTGSGWGITNMPGQQTLSNGALEAVNNYIDLTRVMFNSDEIMTGDMLSKNLSGTAIAQIEAMRTKNVDRKQKRVWRFIEGIGRIIHLFIQGYYEKEYFSYHLSEDVYEKINSENDGSIPRDFEVEFDKKNIENVNFDIVCEVGAGSQFSEIMEMQMLDNLLASQHINFEQYVQLYPQNQMPYKTKLMQMIKADKQSELSQWKQAYQEVVSSNEQLQQQLQISESRIKQIDIYNANLKKVFKETIDGKNTEISGMKDFMATLPASEEISN